MVFRIYVEKKPEYAVAAKERMPCGEPNCTCRKVLEYSPQSTVTASARNRGASCTDKCRHQVNMAQE